MDAQETALADEGPLGSATLRTITADARSLHAMATSGAVAIDPDSALGIATAYDQMVDEIYWIKVCMLSAGQHPRLGTSPYATTVADYQHEAAEAFLAAVVELETACRVCADAFRESVRHYVEQDDDAADALTGTGRTV